MPRSRGRARAREADAPAERPAWCPPSQRHPQVEQSQEPSGRASPRRPPDPRSPSRGAWWASARRGSGDRTRRSGSKGSAARGSLAGPSRRQEAHRSLPARASPGAAWKIEARSARTPSGWHVPEPGGPWPWRGAERLEERAISPSARRSRPWLGHTIARGDHFHKELAVRRARRLDMPPSVRILAVRGQESFCSWSAVARDSGRPPPPGPTQPASTKRSRPPLGISAAAWPKSPRSSNAERALEVGGYLRIVSPSRSQVSGGRACG